MSLSCSPFSRLEKPTVPVPGYDLTAVSAPHPLRNTAQAISERSLSKTAQSAPYPAALFGLKGVATHNYLGRDQSCHAAYVSRAGTLLLFSSKRFALSGRAGQQTTLRAFW